MHPPHIPFDGAAMAGSPIAAGVAAMLSERQGRLWRRLAAGASSTELAARLGVTRRMLWDEQRALLATLGVGSLAEARVLWWGSRAGAREDLRLAAAALSSARPAPVEAA
jgi:DNA-binding CsgD family transcriptional regulator